MINRIKKLFKKIHPESIQEAYDIRKTRFIVMTVLLLSTLTTACLGFITSGHIEVVSVISILTAWISFYVFLVVLANYHDFVKYFRDYLDEYIFSAINATDVSEKSPHVENALFEQLSEKESVNCIKNMNGDINGKQITYTRYSVTYYPERRNGGIYGKYDVFQFKLNSKLSSHIYIDGRDNQTILGYSSPMKLLRSCIKHNSRVELEGDFTKRFNVYYNSKKGFKPLATLTPDVMQELGRLSNAFDIEFIDDTVRIISDGSSYSLDAFLSKLNQLVELLTDLPKSTGMYKNQTNPLHVRRPRDLTNK